MPYRINAYVNPPIPSYWEQLQVILGKISRVVIVVVGVIGVLAIGVGAHALIAYGIHWVVKGMVGHPVGNFWHYFVGVILCNILLRRGEK